MQTTFLIFLCVSVRVVAMLISSPVFSLSQIPSMVKVGLSIILGVLITGTININKIIIPTSTFELFIVIAKEVMVGISIGYIATLIFNTVRVSAQLIDFTIGFSMAQYYDPSTSGNSTPIERFFNWIAIVIFVTFNFHHILLSAIIKSFEAIPAGIYQMSTNSFLVIIDVFSKSFYLAMQLAAPIIIVLFLTDFTMGLVARTVPQINVFILGMPIKVLVGLLAISAILPGLTHMYVKVFEGMSGDIIKYFNVFPAILLMASDDKTEEPTAKKIQDAKKKGQVPKSNDLNSAVGLLGAAAILMAFSNLYYTNGRLFIIDSFKFLTKNEISGSQVANIFIYMVKYGLIAALPIILTVMLLGIVSNIAQAGFMATSEGLKPKFERFNPIEGIKRIFSKRSLMELFKSLAKIILITYIAYSYIKNNILDILKTSDLNTSGIFPFVKNIADGQLIRLVAIMFIIAFADLIFQRRQFKKNMRMTKQEVKEEFKQMEGDPQIKSRIKQRQREMATRRMMSEVPKATVVVTNPTHFAVALKYERNSGSAPRVVAKGADLIAMKIKEIARENKVPIIENKPVARALFSKVEIDQEIPAELYQAVAEIIAYVYSMKKM